METDNTKKFNKLFSELEGCDDDEQKQKIEEIDVATNEMGNFDFLTVFTVSLFNKMDKMIEEKKISLENVILIILHLGNCKMFENLQRYNFCISFLGKRFEKMIKEEWRKEVRNEKVLVDLCKCYVLLWIISPSKELLSICIPCLLKAALNKEKSEKTQKEVEMALFVLSNDEIYYFVERELYLKEITEIIKHQQKHHNLTHLAYQSAWQFLIFRLHFDKSLEDVIANELHFAREAGRELEELMKYVDWKRGKGGNGEKEEEEEILLKRWFILINVFLSSCKVRNNEFVGLFNSIVQMFRAAKEDHRVISELCTNSFVDVARSESVKVEDLLEGGAFDVILEEIQQPTLNDRITFDILLFFDAISLRLKRKKKDEYEEMKRKAAKMEIFEKMEEEGYEDIITSFYEIIDFLNEKLSNYFVWLSSNISDYFVNV